MKKFISILLVLVLFVFLFAGSAFAYTSDLTDFYWYSLAGGGQLVYVGQGDNYVKSYLTYPLGSISNPVLRLSVLLDFNSSVSSGTILGSSSFFNAPWISSVYLFMFDSSGSVLDSHIFPTHGDCSIVSGTRYLSINTYVSDPPDSYIADNRYTFTPSQIFVDNLILESAGSAGGSAYDPSLDQDILAGVEAIAQSLLDLETGPYTTTSSVSLNANGVVTPTTIQQATLEQLLSLIGASSTYSGLVLEQMNLNFGNYFEYHEIEDTSSGTVTVVKNLPSYVNALGMELTDGINKLQRDNLLIYQQGEDIEDALYTDKSENQPWSVAQWLKDIYSSITSFFSSFWSPAETDLKTSAEDGMQAAADNGNAASGSQVDDVNSAADAFKEFGSTGNIGSGDVMDIFSDGASYDFFSQTTKDNLAYHPPAGGRRMLRSSSDPVESDQIEEEYVDELDDKLSYWREVLGLP